MPAQLPAWAGSWCVGGWHWKRPGHFPDKAGGEGLLPEEAARKPLHPQVAQREGNIPVSVMLGMWLPRRRIGEELPGGWRLGKGPRARKTLQALGEKLRKVVPVELGPRWG